jgi:glycosyltransferase involved in cell wall biosynthesis
MNHSPASGQLRVAMLIQDYLPSLGGAERQLSSLTPRLARKGLDVHVLTRQRGGWGRLDLCDGASIHRLAALGPRAAASALYTASALLRLRRLEPAVLHAHGLLSPATTALAARRLWRTPVLAKPLRGGIYGDINRLRRKPGGRLRLAALAREIDAFAVISREIDGELDELGVPPARRLYLQNGVDTRAFHPLDAPARAALRGELRLPPGPLAVFSGRLAPEKNLADLLSVWPQVRAEIGDATLLILGSGPEHSSVARAASAGVILRGEVDEACSYLACADVFVLPSLGEGLSNALLEAMASGLAVVATEVGGTTDVIHHRYSGWLVPPRAPSELLAGLLVVLRDRNLARELGQRARAHVVEHHDLDSLASQLAALYRQLARDAASGGARPAR